MIRHARYGPTDRYLDPPPAGMCLSVFAVITKGNKVLVGTPRKHRAWKARWLFSWTTYSPKELEEACREKRLPSTYLLEREHPEDALRRIMRDQVRMPDYTQTGPRIFSYSAPSDWYPGHDHWDLAFVYDVRCRGPLVLAPWWKELSFVDRGEIDPADFGWNSDFVKDLGVATTDTKSGRRVA
jgi:hypothetical protein